MHLLRKPLCIYKPYIYIYINIYYGNMHYILYIIKPI